MALSKTTSGLKDTSKVLEQAASKASELQPSDPAASDVKAAVEQVLDWRRFFEANFLLPCSGRVFFLSSTDAQPSVLHRRAKNFRQCKPP
jgi:hypothetical protein